MLWQQTNPNILVNEHNNHGQKVIPVSVRVGLLNIDPSLVGLHGTELITGPQLA